MTDTKSIIDDILTPKREFTPIPFWFLNGGLEKEKLKAQLEDFNEKGVNAVVLHPRMGLPQSIEYLSGKYFDIIEFIVKTAEELDMRVVLYDEAMYPSGSAHGLVAKSDMSLASHGITLTKESGIKTLAEFDDGLKLVFKPTGGTIRGVHFGEDDGEPHAPLSADILNPKAVDKFIEFTHERYYMRLKKYFGSTVIGFFTDEPSVTGRGTSGFFGWTHGFEEEFTAKGGKLRELRALFENKTNASTTLYRSLLTKRLNTVYYKKLYDWCENHNIQLMGHPAESDDADEQSYFHVPGQDLIFRRVSPETGGVCGTDSVQAKCSSDTARCFGRRRNSNECFGACSRGGIPWHFTGADMKWYIDWLAVRGVNMFIPHAFFYSVSGKRKDERPPDVGPNNIWWKHYRLFSDYIKRVSYIMTDSKNHAETAVLCKSGDMKADEVKAFFEHQIEFNYLPVSLLNDAEVKNGRLRIGGYEYKYVLGMPVKGVKEMRSAEEAGERDFLTENETAALRVTHITKNGADMYFAVNEGLCEINTLSSVPAEGNASAVDLWNGRVSGLEGERRGGRTHFNLRLKPFESILILFGKNRVYAPPRGRTEIHPVFRLLNETAEKKIYVSEYIYGGCGDELFFKVDFSEMAELYINGRFTSVSFFDNEFPADKKLLRHGKNEIKLIVYASAANKYNGADIPFGLKIPD